LAAAGVLRTAAPVHEHLGQFLLRQILSITSRCWALRALSEIIASETADVDSAGMPNFVRRLKPKLLVKKPKIGFVLQNSLKPCPSSPVSAQGNNSRSRSKLLDSKMALSVASIAAEKDRFVSQKTAPAVLIASALAASEGAHPARHRSSR
jgi:hypothetical protein